MPSARPSPSTCMKFGTAKSTLSPGSIIAISAIIVASEEPFVTSTLAAEAPGYQEAIADLRSGLPSVQP